MPKPNVLSRIAGVLTYPLRLEDYLSLIDPRHSSRQLRAAVTSVTRETDRVVTLGLRPGPGWQPHRAGQWVRVGVEVDGTWYRRPFSISSAEGELPSITVGAAGRVTEAIVASARVGDVVLLDQPQGDFVLPNAPGPLLFVAAGTGITPLMSMIATVLRRDPDADIVLVHVSRTAQDAIFAGRLKSLAACHPRFRVIPWHSRAAGRMTLEPANLGRLVPDWQSRAAFVCGPPGMISDAQSTWADTDGTLAVERFTLTRLIPEGTEGGTVRFARSGREADAAAAASLLEVGEAAGVGLPCGCRMGICRTCLTRLTDGQVRDLVTGDVHGEPGDYIRTCVSAAVGDVSLDA